MGDFEVRTLVRMESSVEYHPVGVLNLTLDCYEEQNSLYAVIPAIDKLSCYKDPFIRKSVRIISIVFCGSQKKCIHRF